MSTTSLPAYVPPNFHNTPLYSEEPHEYEQRIALSDRYRTRPTGTWVKEAKSGGVRLKLSSQHGDAILPVYGLASSVDGVVEIAKTEGITSVEVKVEGRLRLKEIAEGGTVSAKLCLDTALLWVKDPSGSPCPSSIPFSLNLPNKFEFDGKTYPLPPTYEVKMSGLPGFHASIDYSVCAIVSKPNSAVPNLLPTNLFGINIGNSVTISTSFVYYPRSRPAVRPAIPLRPSHGGFESSPEWRIYESTIATKSTSMADISTRLYLPASRLFCVSHRIPFYLTLQSSAASLAAFLPFAPSSLSKRPTRVQLMRQVSVDVRNELVLGTKADMWRVDCIGEANFRRLNDGPTWVTYSGEIAIDSSVKVVGFKAGGLSVKDCILFSMTPVDPKKSPFRELRQVVPVRLTTDVWVADGTGVGANPQSNSQYSIASSPENSSE